MSLIRAIIDKDAVIIVGDTKLSFSHKTNKHYRENHPDTGVIKSVILSPKLCVSFAGDMDYVEEAIKRINQLQDFEHIAECLLNINGESIKSGHDTEFIIAYFNGKPKLMEVKNNSINYVQNSWIGSQIAFEKFQKEYLEKTISGKFAPFFEIRKTPDGFTEEQGKRYTRLFSSMKQVIDDESLEEVGGYIVPVFYTENSFKYGSYVSAYRRPINEKELNKAISFTGAVEGGYCVNFFSNNIDSIAIHLFQGKLGIHYYKNEIGMYYPNLYYNYDEIDFVDKMEQEYKTTADILLQADYRLYFRKGLKAIEKDIELAKRHFDKAKNQFWNDMSKKYNKDICNNVEHFRLLDNKERKFISSCIYNIGVYFFYKGNLIDAIANVEIALIFDESNEKYIKSLIEIKERYNQVEG